MYKHDYVCLGLCIRNYVLCKKGKYFKGTSSIHKVSMCKIDTGRLIIQIFQIQRERVNENQRKNMRYYYGRYCIT